MPTHNCPPAATNDSGARRAIAGALLVIALLQADIALSQTAENTASAQAVERKSGEKLYQAHCARCHGNDGAGDVTSVTPVIAGQQRAYLLRQLADVANEDRQIDEMHRLLSTRALQNRQALHEVATYVANLTPPTAVEHGRGDQLELGKRMFANGCAKCHGPDAESGDELIPTLAGQHYSYLLRQMRRLAAGHRYGVDAATITHLNDMSSAEHRALADYLSRLPRKSVTD